MSGSVVDPVVDPWVELETELVIDQPDLKAWVEVVPPGESRPAHTHRYPWVTVVLSGASGTSHGPDGEVLSQSRLATGQVVYNGVDRLPLCHYVHNTSDSTLVMVAVELRGPGTRAGEES